MNQIIFQVWGSTLYESVNSYGWMELGKAPGLGLGFSKFMTYRCS